VPKALAGPSGRGLVWPPQVPPRSAKNMDGANSSAVGFGVSLNRSIRYYVSTATAGIRLVLYGGSWQEGRRLVLSHRVVMAQHFLLSAAARSLSTAKIMRMSDSGVENVFLRLRWPETDGMPVCPGCGGTICYACPRISGRPRWRCKACRGDFSITSGTLFAWHKLI
jgi:hypothetical protein